VTSIDRYDRMKKIHECLRGDLKKNGFEYGSMRGDSFSYHKSAGDFTHCFVCRHKEDHYFVIVLRSHFPTNYKGRLEREYHIAFDHETCVFSCRIDRDIYADYNKIFQRCKNGLKTR